MTPLSATVCQTSAGTSYIVPRLVIQPHCSETLIRHTEICASGWSGCAHAACQLGGRCSSSSTSTIANRRSLTINPSSIAWLVNRDACSSGNPRSSLGPTYRWRPPTPASVVRPLSDPSCSPDQRRRRPQRASDTFSEEAATTPMRIEDCLRSARATAKPTRHLHVTRVGLALPSMGQVAEAIRFVRAVAAADVA